jgi:glycosyltransferase involved in cell wall biosynthesis
VLRPEKDLPTLLRAFATLLREHPRSRLLLLGSGPEAPLLRNQAAQLGIADATLFSPATPDVTPWLRMLDIFVLPSRTEALSNSLTEAMSCGVCAIASRVGGNPELLGEDERGFLFDVSDYAGLAQLLIRLADEPECRRLKALKAREWIVQNLTLRIAANRMADIYEKRLASGCQISDLR